MTEWKDISSAPKDQRVLIAVIMPAFKNIYVGEAIQEDGGKWWWANTNWVDDPGMYIVAAVTHWQPLPDPPASPTARER